MKDLKSSKVVRPSPKKVEYLSVNPSNSNRKLSAKYFSIAAFYLRSGNPSNGKPQSKAGLFFGKRPETTPDILKGLPTQRLMNNLPTKHSRGGNNKDWIVSLMKYQQTCPKKRFKAIYSLRNKQYLLNKKKRSLIVDRIVSRKSQDVGRFEHSKKLHSTRQ